VIADAGNDGEGEGEGEGDGHDDETTGASPLIGLTISSAAAAAAASCILLYDSIVVYFHCLTSSRRGYYGSLAIVCSATFERYCFPREGATELAKSRW
jgi:hypothetical protein